MDIYESSFRFDDDDCGEEGVSAVLVGSAGVSELIQRALALSRARVWREASAEWAIIGASDREYPDGTCECGHPNIRYEYVVGNGVTGAVIDPVGSSCVQRFGNQEMRNYIREYEEMAKLRTRARTSATGLTGKDFSTRTLACLLDRGVITRNQEKAIVACRRHTPGRGPLPRTQRMQFELIMANRVVPYLHELDQTLLIR